MKIILSAFVIIIALMGSKNVLERVYGFDILFTLLKKSERIKMQEIVSHCSTQAIVLRCPNKDYMIYSPELMGLEAAYTEYGDTIYSYSSMGGFEPTAVYAIRKIQRQSSGCTPSIAENLCKYK